MAEYIERAEVERILMEKYNRYAGMRPDFYAGFMAAYKTIEEQTISYDFAPENSAEQIKWERDMAMEQLKSYGVGFMSTDECKKVVHGKWIEKVGRAECSVCRDECWADSAMEYGYCPACGAKMEQEDE